jgi:hypothetical protein
MPDTEPCNGCCVKIVQYIGTEHYQIKRTCSENFEVNYFMVNHACMTEGHRHGRMCFCGTERCNGGWRPEGGWGVLQLAAVLTALLALR